jgi:hypothetical protein
VVRNVAKGGFSSSDDGPEMAGVRKERSLTKGPANASNGTASAHSCSFTVRQACAIAVIAQRRGQRVKSISTEMVWLVEGRVPF